MTKAVGNIADWAGDASKRVSSVLFDSWSNKDGAIDLYNHFQHGNFISK